MNNTIINVILFALIVFVWGTTGFAIKMQTGYGPNEICVLYRSGIAALLMLLWCKFNKINLKFEAKDHLYLFALGVCMFSVHYLFFYKAMNYAISGVVVVIFSSVSFLSILHNFVFFKVKPTFNACIGALLGIVGLSLFFWDELSQAASQENAIKGFGLATIGTLIFSLGGSISKRNHAQKLDMVPSGAMGMLYGTLVLVIYSCSQSSQLYFPTSISFWGSLLYLSIVSSIVAFLCYLKLIKNMGPEFAGYATVMCPVVALIASSLFEDFEWSAIDLFSLSLVLVGNIIVMRKKSFFPENKTLESVSN